ncbi:Cysteine--tRNA ligase, partial [Aduncisulcus paluster]
SEAATGKEMARFWVHNGFVQINSEKMSKSLGNFFTIRDILDKFMPETLRYFLLTMHYRSPLDFSFEALEEAEKAALPEEVLAEIEDAEKGWAEAMEDDMNTAGAMGHMFTLIRLAGRIGEEKSWRKSEGGRDAWLRILEDMK